MAVTVSAKNYTIVDDCEDESVWIGSTSNDVTDFFKKGTQCVGFVMKASGNNDTYVAGTFNLSGKHLHAWFMTTALKELNTFAAGGVQISLYDGTNTGYYYVSGSDIYPGGWLNLVLDCDRTPDAGSQPTLTAITQVGLRINLTATSKNAQNTWLDHVYVADGLIAYGDDGGGSFDLADILAIDEDTTYGWGMIRNIGGIYFLVGALDFGDTVGTGDCDFAESGQVVVFEDRPVDAAYYGITVAGNSTGTTEFALGTKSGSQGISGCAIRVASLSQTPKFFIDADDTYIDVCQFYGCQIVDHNAINLPTRDGATPANREVVSTTFESGNAAIVASSCPVSYSNFISSTGVAVQLDSATHYVSNCSFIACQTAVECTVVGDFTFSGMSFSGCTYDVENSANATTTDSYAEGNQDSDQQLYGGAATGAAQSITGDGNELTNITLYLRKVGVPTGNAVVKLYAHSGTFGSSSVPTGVALATSKDLDVSTLGTSYALEKIDFDDSEFYTLANGTKYCVAIEYSGGDSSNRLEVGYDTGGSHGGNKATYTGSWAADASDDLCFYVRTGGDVTIGSTNSNPSSTNETGTPAGVTNVNNAVTVKVTCKDAGDSSDIENARVYLKAAAGGDLPVGTEILNGLSAATGIVQDTNFNYTNPQPVTGWARRASAGYGTLYKQAPITGTITLAAGFDTIALMIQDE